MREALTQMKPNHIEDIIALVALISTRSYEQYTNL